MREKGLCVWRHVVKMLSYMKHLLPLHCFQEEIEMVVAVQLVQ